jgi:hypothetical protein
MYKKIFKELKRHAPFTMFGALTGIVLMMFFHNLSSQTAMKVFYTLHPIHVILSALVTASMYELHRKGKCNILPLLFIGYVGSVGIATLSDSIIPFLGELILSMPNRGVHIGFIEKWWLINPLAIVGIIVAYFMPKTKFPHFGHVLLSTWTSLFHIIMAAGKNLNWVSYILIIIFLFISVWIPCCLSDIAFPLLFVKDR